MFYRYHWLVLEEFAKIGQLVRCDVPTGVIRQPEVQITLSLPGRTPRQPCPCQWQPYGYKWLSWSYASAAAFLFSRILVVNMLSSPTLVASFPYFFLVIFFRLWWTSAPMHMAFLRFSAPNRRMWTPVWPAHCQHCWSYYDFKIISQDSNVEVEGHHILNSSSLADGQRNSQEGVSITFRLIFHSICLYP